MHCKSKKQTRIVNCLHAMILVGLSGYGVAAPTLAAETPRIASGTGAPARRTPQSAAPIMSGRALRIEDGAVVGTVARNGAKQPASGSEFRSAEAENDDGSGPTPIRDGLRDAKRVFQSALDRARGTASPSDRMQQMSRSRLDAELDAPGASRSTPSRAGTPRPFRGASEGAVTGPTAVEDGESTRGSRSALPDRLTPPLQEEPSVAESDEDEPTARELALPTRLATRSIGASPSVTQATEPHSRIPVHQNAGSIQAEDATIPTPTPSLAGLDESSLEPTAPPETALAITTTPAARTPSETSSGSSGRLSATFSSRRSADERMEATGIDVQPNQSARVESFDDKSSGDGASPTSIAPPALSRAVEDAEPLVMSNTGPSIAVRTQGAAKLVVGKASVYTVFVTNSGDVEANDVVVTVHVPSWVEVADKRPSGGRATLDSEGDQSSEIRWTVQQLGAGASEKMELQIVPRESRPVDLAVQWTFTPVGSTAQIEVQEPKLHMTLTGPPDIHFGETKIYTITVSNPGTGDTEHVVLNLLPITAGRDTSATQDLGTLRPGERRSVDVELVAQQAGRLQVRAHAFADGGLRSEASQDVVVRRARLEIEAVGASAKYAGTLSNYQVRVVNAGDATATNVIAVAALPHGAVFKSATEGGKLDVQRNEVRWNLGALRPGAARLFDVGCELTQAGDNRLDVRSEAATDLTAVHSVVTRVEALADLKLIVNDPPGAVPVGGDSQYEVRVINRGTKAAENVQIVGYFSDGIEPVAMQGGKGDMADGQVVLQPILRLNPGQEMVFTITARAHAPGNHVFRTELECGTPYTRLAAEEWTTYYANSAPGGHIPATADAGSQARAEAQ